MPAMRPVFALVGALLIGLAVHGTAVAAEGPEGEGFLQRLAAVINEYRAQNELPPLALAEELADLARGHSGQMATLHQLTHQGFRDRMRATSSKMCVENVAHNFPTPEMLVEGWRRSPGHHRNLLEPKVSRMGLAATARYVTFFACR